MKLQPVHVYAAFFAALAAACVPTGTPAPAVTLTLLPPVVNIMAQSPAPALSASESTPIPTQTPETPTPAATPTLEPYHPQVLSIHYAHSGDTLPVLARRFQVGGDLMRRANLDLPEVGFLAMGTAVTVPDVDLSETPPSFLIIPDGELVYGPGQRDLDLRVTVEAYKGGWLARIMAGNDALAPGWKVVQDAATAYSVNPRLLLALIEYQSGLVTGDTDSEDIAKYPLNVQKWKFAKLPNQLVWAAEQLNAGYYGWRHGHLSELTLADGKIYPLDPRLNAGTVAVYSFFSHLYSAALFEEVIAPSGFAATYRQLFGDPFDYEVAIIEPGLTQPALELPFEPGVVWNFTGGPHNGWRDSAPWAAVDFAPELPTSGCVESDDWVVASADGIITRIGLGLLAHTIGEAETELDGWTLVYVHLRVDRFKLRVGQSVQVGERLGQPSCDGGLETTGTHLHLARKYNGEWMPAGGPPAYVLSDWEVLGEHRAYHGKLVERSSGRSLTACACVHNNQISRPR